MTEHDLQNRIRIELSALGFMTKRTNVGKVKMHDGRFFDSGLPKGHSDLEVHGSNGDTYFIEVKVKPNKPTSEQLNFLKVMESRGFKTGVAYSVEDALAICGGAV